MTVSSGLVIGIVALKKNAVFQDDLVKKLSGVNLVTRAIHKAKECGGGGAEIILFTDSEEIRDIGRRASVHVEMNRLWSCDAAGISEDLLETVLRQTAFGKCMLLISPYTPLMEISVLQSALQLAQTTTADIVVPVFKQLGKPYKEGVRSLRATLQRAEDAELEVESSAFLILNPRQKMLSVDEALTVQSFELPPDILEIRSLRDWWVCEKLLGRKRIVFRVIGDNDVGMGHIYRSLALAHELTDHEILFVTDKRSEAAVNELAGYDYWLGIFDAEEIVEEIARLQPHLVVNDILNSAVRDVVGLKEQGIAVVNFEDLGPGAMFADCVINELYDQPQHDRCNTYWGHEFFFVREEFERAQPQTFSSEVNEILLTFGGIDQHDLTGKVVGRIAEFCLQREIKISIVVGPGYRHFEQLQQTVNDMPLVSVTHATGVISSFMERAQLAVTSNGRTVYELAHMSIPAVVVSQHDREQTHHFGREDNGFVPVGVYQGDDTIDVIAQSIERLVEDARFREEMYQRMRVFGFLENKQRVLKLIETRLLD